MISSHVGRASILKAQISIILSQAQPLLTGERQAAHNCNIESSRHKCDGDGVVHKFMQDAVQRITFESCYLDSSMSLGFRVAA